MLLGERVAQVVEGVGVFPRPPGRIVKEPRCGHTVRFGGARVRPPRAAPAPMPWATAGPAGCWLSPRKARKSWSKTSASQLSQSCLATPSHPITTMASPIEVKLRDAAVVIAQQIQKDDSRLFHQRAASLAVSVLPVAHGALRSRPSPRTTVSGHSA